MEDSWATGVAGRGPVGAGRGGGRGPWIGGRRRDHPVTLMGRVGRDISKILMAGGLVLTGNVRVGIVGRVPAFLRAAEYGGVAGML
jgi:hypothetical protein